MSVSKWQFATRFRHRAFGWKSDKPIQRIKEALTEIKLVAKKEPVLAAEGAVLFLEKISPALEGVDSSSGAIGSMVNRAIETLVPIITKAKAEPPLRENWLERLWVAIQNDDMPYIESLTSYWGDLCGTPEIAARWAEQLMPSVESSWMPQSSGRSYFCGTDACFSALYAADRHQDLLALLAKAPFSWWQWRQWGVKALVAMDKRAEAIQYAKETKGSNNPESAIARACEEILLSSGNYDDAYDYALVASQGTTHLATFRAIAKKYPNKHPEDILRDLVRSQPGSEGKWFAAAKDAGLFDFAIELVRKSPTDPRTLIRAARDYAEQCPAFALSAGLFALYWMSRGYGYQITATDVLDAYKSLILAANHVGMSEIQVQVQVKEVIVNTPENTFILKVLFG
jgi:hypothetical protein